MPSPITGISMSRTASRVATVVSSESDNADPTTPEDNETTDSSTTREELVRSMFSSDPVPDASTASTQPRAATMAASVNNKFEVLKREGLISAVSKRVRPGFERFAKNFANDEPELLFVSEYIVNDSLVGALIVWERYSNATHYEVFKKNHFQTGARFERVLFLGLSSVQEETKQYMSYVRDVLGFTDLDEEKVFIVMDDMIKEDRIYEYMVSAVYVPTRPINIDFDMILESKSLLNTQTIGSESNATLFSLAGTTLGSEALAWTIALVDEKAAFFGRVPSESPLIRTYAPVEENTWQEKTKKRKSVEAGELSISIPKNPIDVLCLVREALSLFEIEDVFSHVLAVLGGLPQEFSLAFLKALDGARTVFSYDKFKEVAKGETPAFNLILNIAESGNAGAVKDLSALSIVVPTNTGSESLTSLDELSKIFNFVNDYTIAVMHAQEDETYLKLQEILQDVEASRAQSREDPLDEAVREIREEIEDQTNNVATTPVGSFFNAFGGDRRKVSSSDDDDDDDSRFGGGGSSTGGSTSSGYLVR